MNKVLSLNSSQLAAIEHESCATLVIAGPGSGKTRTLVAKIQRTLEKTSLNDGRILALTFTNKAAREMLDRLQASGLDENRRCIASTFHSFACELLRQHGHLIGIQPDFAIILEDSDRQSILQEISVEDSQVFSDRNAFSDFKQSLSEIGKSGVNPLKESGTVKHYADNLLAQNRVDMDFVMPFTIHLLQDFPAARELVRMEFPFICVDEFQDTNVAQLAFLKLIANESGSGLFIVADDDQLIYAWNGASVERLQEVRDLFAPKVFQLPENYRCSSDILNLANSLIGNNGLRDAAKLPLVSFADSKGDGGIDTHEFDSDEDEVQWVCSEIAEFFSADTGRIAVLCRNRKKLEPIRDELVKLGIDAQLVVRQDSFLTAEFRWLQAMLKAVARPDDAILLSNLGQAMDEFIGTCVLNAGASSLRNLIDQAKLQLPNNHSYDPILGDTLDELMESPECFHQWIDDAIECICKFKKRVNSAELVNFESDMQAWQEISDDLSLHFGNELELSSFNQEIDMRSKAPSPSDNSVCLMTIHGAKGLEFKHVYLIGMQDDCVPDFRAVKKGDYSPEMEEERRACFVAITRAETNLTFTYSRRSNGYRKWPSRFLAEMGIESVTIHDS